MTDVLTVKRVRVARERDVLTAKRLRVARERDVLTAKRTRIAREAVNTYFRRVGVKAEDVPRGAADVFIHEFTAHTQAPVGGTGFRPFVNSLAFFAIVQSQVKAQTDRLSPHIPSYNAFLETTFAESTLDPFGMPVLLKKIAKKVAPDAPLILSGLNLVGFNLSGINLHRAAMDHTRLRGVDLRGKNLEGTDLRSADLDGVEIDEHTAVTLEQLRTAMNADAVSEQWKRIHHDVPHSGTKGGGESSGGVPGGSPAGGKTGGTPTSPTSAEGQQVAPIGGVDVEENAGIAEVVETDAQTTGVKTPATRTGSAGPYYMVPIISPIVLPPPALPIGR